MAWRAHTLGPLSGSPAVRRERWARHPRASIMRRIATLQIGGKTMHRRLFLAGLAASAACVRAQAAAPTMEERVALAETRLPGIEARGARPPGGLVAGDGR